MPPRLPLPNHPTCQCTTLTRFTILLSSAVHFSPYAFSPSEPADSMAMVTSRVQNTCELKMHSASGVETKSVPVRIVAHIGAMPRCCMQPAVVLHETKQIWKLARSRQNGCTVTQPSTEGQCRSCAAGALTWEQLSTSWPGQFRIHFERGPLVYASKASPATWAGSHNRVWHKGCRTAVTGKACAPTHRGSKEMAHKLNAAVPAACGTFAWLTLLQAMSSHPQTILKRRLCAHLPGCTGDARIWLYR